jgi:hypothetical protein
MYRKDDYLFGVHHARLARKIGTPLTIWSTVRKTLGMN